MAIYDFSKAPCGVTITNTSNKDMKISLSGHSQSFILTAGNSAILKAKTSSELIGYLSQLQDGIKVEFPGLPTSSDLPYTFTLLRAPIDWDSESEIPTQSTDAFDIGVPIEKGSFYKLSYQIEGESATDVTVCGTRPDIGWPVFLVNMENHDVGTFGKYTDVGEDQYGLNIMVMGGSLIEITEQDPIYTTFVEPGHVCCFILNGYTVEGIEGDPTNKKISILSIEKIADVMVPISITATGCTVSVVDDEDNVYGDGDSVKWGTDIHFVVTALPNYDQNAITFDGGGYYRLSSTDRAESDITLIVSAALL
jgi:hypothetical protein